MPVSKQYFSILKAKAGEYRALKNLDLSYKASIMPIVEVQPIPMNYDGQLGIPTGPQCTLDQNVEKIAERIEKVWGTENPICVDLLHLDDYGTLADGTYPLTYVLNDAARRG